MKLHIITLQYDNTIKRLYLEGEDNEDAKEQLKQALRGIPDIGESSEKFSVFLKRAVAHFKNHGFIRIAK